MKRNLVAARADSTTMWVDKHEGGTEQKDTQHVGLILHNGSRVQLLLPQKNYSVT